MKKTAIVLLKVLKKALGVFFLLGGILNICNLGRINIRTIPELLGALTGIAFIFFLAWLCLKSPKKKASDDKQNKQNNAMQQ